MPLNVVTASPSQAGKGGPSASPCPRHLSSPGERQPGAAPRDVAASSGGGVCRWVWDPGAHPRCRRSPALGRAAVPAGGAARPRPRFGPRGLPVSRRAEVRSIPQDAHPGPSQPGGPRDAAAPPGGRTGVARPVPPAGTGGDVRASRGCTAQPFPTLPCSQGHRLERARPGLVFPR